MTDLQQQKIDIDLEAQRAKDEIDKKAASDRQYVADGEIRKVEAEAAYKIQQIKRDAAK